METLIIHAETNKIEALVTLLKAFDIRFEIKKPKSKEETYSPEFIKTMDKSILQVQQGKLTTVTLDEIWK